MYQMANIIRIRGLYAHHTFSAEKKYEEAISILNELKASPLDVINLFPQFSIGKSHNISSDTLPVTGIYLCCS